MEIIIGTTPPLGQPYTKTPVNSNGLVEAKLLHVRPPRRGVAGPSGVERRGKKSRDPLNARVLTIMVPDADTLPKDIDTGDFRVILRLSKK